LRRKSVETLEDVLPPLHILAPEDLVKGDEVNLTSTSVGHNLGNSNPKAEVKHILLATRKALNLEFLISIIDKDIVILIQFHYGIPPIANETE